MTDDVLTTADEPGWVEQEELPEAEDVGDDPWRELPTLPAQAGTPEVVDPQAGDVTLPDYTDTTFANLFLADHGRVVRHVTEADGWLHWDGTRWVRDEKQVDRLFQVTVARIEAQALQALSSARTAEEQANGEYETKRAKEATERAQEHLSNLRRYKNTQKINAALARAMKHESIEVRADALDQKPYLLNCRNGTIDLVTGQLRPHDPADLLTLRIEHDYRPEAKCPLWERSLIEWMEGDAEVCQFLQLAVGVTILGKSAEEVLFFLWGPGENGKSKFLLALQELLGPYATTAADNLLTGGANGVAPHDVATLLGVRLAVAPEVNDRRAFAESDLKRLVSEDRLRACRKYESPFDFAPSHTLWLMGNHLPVIKGNDKGVWRRMRIVPFTMVLTEGKKDTRLPEKLREEYEGILAWAVRGCVEYLRRGTLPTPKKVQEVTETYKKDMDLLGAFLDECVQDDVTKTVTGDDLYRVYEDWCQRSGLLKLSKPKLTRELKLRGWEQKKNNCMHWVGRTLLATPVGGSSYPSTRHPY